jgi:hypothetical protein
MHSRTQASHLATPIHPTTQPTIRISNTKCHACRIYQRQCHCDCKKLKSSRTLPSSMRFAVSVAGRSGSPFRPCARIGRLLTSSSPGRACFGTSSCDELLVDTTQVPGVALVTFNRPSRLNALSLEMGEAVKQLGANLPDSTRAVVFTGTCFVQCA